MPGIRVRHKSLRASVALVPVLKKPLRGSGPNGVFDPILDQCPSCHLVHTVKTVHLWLDDAGGCIVSQGVLEELRLAGLPDLEVGEEVKKPPALTLGIQREKLDKESRKIVYRR